jgi:melanoma-associated antigen
MRAINHSIVLGSSARAFPLVFQRAQVILRRTFGMELVELHRGQTVEDAEEAQTGTGMRKKGMLP